MAWGRGGTRTMHVAPNGIFLGLVLWACVMGTSGWVFAHVGLGIYVCVLMIYKCGGVEKRLGLDGSRRLPMLLGIPRGKRHQFMPCWSYLVPCHLHLPPSLYTKVPKQVQYMHAFSCNPKSSNRSIEKQKEKHRDLDESGT